MCEGKSIFPQFSVNAPMPPVLPPRPSWEQVERLAMAIWQLLDDMQTDGQCACRLAIAEARIAYEPFMTDEEGANDDLMPLEVAQRIVAEFP